jgi:hypothetical protein
VPVGIPKQRPAGNFEQQSAKNDLNPSFSLAAAAAAVAAATTEADKEAAAVAAVAEAAMAILARRMAGPVSEQQETAVALSVKVLAALMRSRVGCDLLLWQHKVRCLWALAAACQHVACTSIVYRTVQ